MVPDAVPRIPLEGAGGIIHGFASGIENPSPLEEIACGMGKNRGFGGGRLREAGGGVEREERGVEEDEKEGRED